MFTNDEVIRNLKSDWLSEAIIRGAMLEAKKENGTLDSTCLIVNRNIFSIRECAKELDRRNEENRSERIRLGIPDR